MTDVMSRLSYRRGAAVITAGIIVVIFFIIPWGEKDETTHSGIHSLLDDKQRQRLSDDKNNVGKQTPSHVPDVIENINTQQMFCLKTLSPSSSYNKSFINLRAAYHDPRATVQPMTWTNESDVTSRFYSTFSISDKKTSYSVCDTIHVVITARNRRGELKRYGGDYFRARLVQNDHRGHTSSTMSDGEVVDNGDGTYSAIFTLKWPGEAVIRVYLVHSSEAVSVLRYQRDHQLARYSYKGGFCLNGNDLDEERECNIYIPSKLRHVCKFTDRRTRNSWYCLYPTQPELNCSSWCRHRSDIRGANAVMRTVMTEKELTVIKMSDVSLLHSKDYTIQVNTTTDGAMEMLPPCEPGFHAKTTLVSGYYDDDRWTSPYCNILRFSSAPLAAAKCLRGKTLFFLGDSMARHMFDHLLKRFGKDTEILQDNVNSASKAGPIVARNSAHDIAFVFRSHGYPLGDEVVHDIHNIQYIANTLSDLQVDDKSVITISLWEHFTPHNLTFYEHRLREVLMAVRRVHERSPGTLIVFRSPSTRELDSVETMVYASDWLARDLNSVLRKVLSEYSNIGFLDAWDMTNAQLYPHRLHPVGSHLDNIADHLLSYICPHG